MVVLLPIHFSCDSIEFDAADTLHIDQILISWSHSYEEETDSIKIYRPSETYEFPPSRFRQKFIFSDSSECAYLKLAANDGHYMVSANWSYEAQSNTISISDTAHQTIFKFKVLQLTNNILRMAELR